MATQTLHVTKAVRNEESAQELRAAVAVRRPHRPVVPPVRRQPAGADDPRARVARRAARRSARREPAFVAICQSGFPEVEHNEVAVEICRNFAADAGFEWAGGLILAAGGMIGGQPLRKLQGMMRSAVKALDLTAEALAAGRPVPDEAVQLMAKPPIPKSGYRFMANWGWRSQFKKRGRGGSLKDRPYA